MDILEKFNERDRFLFGTDYDNGTYGYGYANERLFTLTRERANELLFKGWFNDEVGEISDSSIHVKDLLEFLNKTEPGSDWRLLCVAYGMYYAEPLTRELVTRSRCPSAIVLGVGYCDESRSIPYNEISEFVKVCHRPMRMEIDEHHAHADWSCKPGSWVICSDNGKCF